VETTPTESVDVLMKILDLSADEISYLSPDFTFRYANAAYLKSKDETLESIKGKPFADYYDDELVEAHIGKFVEALGGTPQAFESRVVSEGRSVVYLTRLLPHFNAEGNIDGLITYCTDRTEETAAAQSFGSVMNSIPGRVCMIDADYKILYSNNNMRNQYPRPLEDGEVLLSDLLQESDWAITRRNIDVAFTGQHVHFQHEFSFQSGDRKDMSIYLTPTKTADQSAIAGVYILVLDDSELTETKSQLQRTEKNFDVALKSHLVAFWELDSRKDDWILAEHIERLLGLTKGHLNNSIASFLDRIHPDDRDKAIFDGASERGESFAEELRCRTATGEYHWFRLVGNRENDSNGNTLSLAGTLADVNSLKNAEILAADRLAYRDSFLSMLSHELRNPVAGIQYAIDIIGNEPEAIEQLPNKCKTSFGIVSRQTAIIKRLLDDLLHVGRVSQDQILFEEDEICFSELINEVVGTAKAVFAQKNQTLKYSCDAKAEIVKGDRVRLTQAFVNLIDNASKFSQPESEFEVNCRIEGDSIVTSVCDGGDGIAPQAVAKIFDLFFQEQQPLDREAGGLGVGLYLVKKIANAHMGSVEVISPGTLGGCDFELRLPISKVYNAGPSKPTNPSTGKLVLVEDNEDVRLALSLALESRGFDVTTFEDGQLAIDAIPGLTPKIVLIDIGLPRKDGLEVISELKKNLNLKETVFIALTGYGQQHEREMILNAGFDNHMVKPVDISELCSIITTRSLA